MNELTINESERRDYLERIIERNIKGFIDTGSALLEIRDNKLYKDEYSTFEEYCKERWNISRRHAYELINANKVLENLCATAHTLPISESQLRPLTSLEPEQQKALWAKAVETAPNNKVTAAHVQQIVDDYKKPVKEIEWLPEEYELLEKIKKGNTVLINMYKHVNTLEYAQQKGIYVRIDRATEWGNPFIVDQDGTREDVCYWYEHYYFPYKKGLHKKIEQLKGKVLGCHCYPNQCHGETLIKFINDKNFDFSTC